MHKILLTLFAILALNCQKDPGTPAPNPPKEPQVEVTDAVRGVWIPAMQHTDFLSSKANMEKWLTEFNKIGINTVFVVMWNQSRTLYPSKIMRDSFGVEIDERLTGRDPLRELLEVAKAKNIKVYAWFEYGFAARYTGAPPSELLTKHPDWATIGADGKPVVKNGFHWMNSLNPRVQNLLQSLILEVVDNYDVTGIQGDDRLPAMPTEGGYDAVTKDLYRKETGREAPSDFKEAAWVDWRADKLNQFMQRLHSEIKRRKPNMQVSMSPSAFPFAKTEYLQDWPTWVKNGWVDMIVPQLYRYDAAAYKAELVKAIGQVPPDKQKIFYPGVLLAVGKNYVASVDLLQRMINENRQLGLRGEVYFFNEGIVGSRAFFDKVYKK